MYFVRSINLFVSYVDGAPRTWADLFFSKRKSIIGTITTRIERREYGRFCLKIQFWYQQFEVV